MCYHACLTKCSYIEQPEKNVSITNKKDVGNDSYFVGSHGNEDSRTETAQNFVITMQNMKDCAWVPQERN